MATCAADTRSSSRGRPSAVTWHERKGLGGWVGWCVCVCVFVVVGWGGVGVGGGAGQVEAAVSRGRPGSHALIAAKPWPSTVAAASMDWHRKGGLCQLGGSVAAAGPGLRWQAGAPLPYPEEHCHALVGQLLARIAVGARHHWQQLFWGRCGGRGLSCAASSHAGIAAASAQRQAGVAAAVARARNHHCPHPCLEAARGWGAAPPRAARRPLHWGEGSARGQAKEADVHAGSLPCSPAPTCGVVQDRGDAVLLQAAQCGLDTLGVWACGHAELEGRLAWQQMPPGPQHSAARVAAAAPPPPPPPPPPPLHLQQTGGRRWHARQR